MIVLTWIHVASGILALLAGTAAVAARKGGRIHVRAGTTFSAAMLVMALTGSVIAATLPEPGTAAIGLLASYLVLTSWAAARRRDGSPSWFEKIACAAALGTGALVIQGAMNGSTALADPGSASVFGALCILAGMLDLNAILRAPLRPAQRIARHLWRMCFAFFIATGSFFLGQQDVMPASVRGSPVLFLLALAPFAIMAFWLVRIRFAKAMVRLKQSMARSPAPALAPEA